MQEQITAEKETIVYPSIIFKIKGSLYCANSQYISTIVQLPKFSHVPDAPDYVSGIFPHRENFVQMINLRSLLGYPTLAGEYETFCTMLEERKQDHVHWVKELERSIKTGEKFTLATDPHKCKLGKWYDSFKTDNNAVRFHINKLDMPHKNLHKAALEVESCLQQCSTCNRDECLKNVLNRTKNEYMPTILQLLEEAKNIFKTTVFHSMVLILNNNRAGLVVDEVLAVENLPEAISLPSAKQLHSSRFITGITHSKIPGEILELNLPEIMTFIHQ